MKSDLPERTFAFAVRIVELCRLLGENQGVSRTLVNQLLRSGTSMGANVEEGQASQSEADFLAKYGITCKEARDTQYWLRFDCNKFVYPMQLEKLIRGINLNFGN